MSVHRAKRTAITAAVATAVENKFRSPLTEFKKDHVRLDACRFAHARGARRHLNSTHVLVEHYGLQQRRIVYGLKNK